MEASILQYPDFKKPFVFYPDTSRTGISAVLSQMDEEKRERVIAYASRSLNKAETNYGITDQECLVIVWAVKHFEQYLGLLPFKVVTDHFALKFYKLQKCQQEEEPNGSCTFNSLTLKLFIDQEKRIKMQMPYHDLQRFTVISPELK